jgi:mRNA interferase RelE/StbE
MKLIPSEQFKKDAENLPEQIRKIMVRKLGLLLADARHPSLRTKRIKGRVKGFKNVFEASITMNYRFLFRIENDSYILLTCGTHDELFK